MYSFSYGIAKVKTSLLGPHDEHLAQPPAQQAHAGGHGLLGNNEEMGAMANQMLSSLPPQMAGKDVFDVLAMMTDEQRSQMITAINDKMKEMPDSILEQSAVVFVEQIRRWAWTPTRCRTNYVLLGGV